MAYPFMSFFKRCVFELISLVEFGIIILLFLYQELRFLALGCMTYNV